MQRLAALPAITVVVDQKAHITKGSALADLLAIRHDRIAQDVQAISVQIAEWGRLAALARKHWQEAERAYRVFRDRIIVEQSTPQGDGWKKPTDKIIEATYRTNPDYARAYQAIEMAEEQYNACVAVCDGLRAKKDMMRHFVMRSIEDSSPRLAV